ncbi:MAG: hypothetical protein ACFE0O_01785 [Opitutales bacterium]
MAGPEQTVTGLILRKSPRGERFHLLTLLADTSGLRRVLIRRPGQNPRHGSLQPDLFDTGRLRLEQAGRTSGDADAPWFVKEFVLERRRTALATRYPAFVAACAFAQLIVDNAGHLHGADSLHGPVGQVLDHLAGSERPDIGYLKGVYRFLRDEGFPARQQFLARLDPADARAAETLLRQPTRDLKDHPTEGVRRIIQQVHRWMRQDLDMLVPAYPADHKD